MEFNDATDNGKPNPDRNQPTPISVILENEILMMKLNAEFGATIFLPDTRASPEIENHFLRSVYAIERQMALTSGRKSIFEIIGRPGYPADPGPDDPAIAELLEQLLDLLYDHKIVLDTLADYPDRVLYDFIINEFFTVELDHHPGADFFIHFCYEDFYPNHDFDLRQASAQFAGFAMDLHQICPRNGLYRHLVDAAGKRVAYPQAVEKIRASLLLFEERNLKKFIINNVSVLDDFAFVESEILYVGKLPAGELVEVSGPVRFDFFFEKGNWWITSLIFPGIIY